MESTGSVRSPAKRIEREPLETVRVVLVRGDKILFLRKSLNSKMPLSWELPGGKIDGLKKGQDSTLEQQKEAAKKEVLEETNIDIKNLTIVNVETFNKRYETVNEFDQVELHKGIVHLFLVYVSDEDIAGIQVGKTLNASGKPEDHHDNYGWASVKDLPILLKSVKNPISGREVKPLSRSSRHFAKLLQMVIGRKNRKRRKIQS